MGGRGDNVMEAVMQRRSRSIQLSLDKFCNWIHRGYSPLWMTYYKTI